MNFVKLVAEFPTMDLQVKSQRGSNRLSRLEIRFWPRPTSFDRRVKRKGIAVERSWAQNIHATEAQEALALIGQLKAAKNTIKRLKKEVDTNGLEIMTL